jgi:two-component system response regulator NreC
MLYRTDDGGRYQLMTNPGTREGTERKTRILIVDDHVFVREGIARLLGGEPDLSVSAEAGGARQALEALEREKFDLAIVDLSLGSDSGLDLIKAVKARHPKLPVLVISMHDETIYAERALRAGASGYLMKHEATERVLLAIRQLLAGGVHVSDRIQATMMGRMVGRSAGGDTSVEALLSDRELEILRYIGAGLKTAEIARQLKRSVKSIEAHRARLKQKLGLRNAAELASYAARWADRG